MASMLMRRTVFAGVATGALAVVVSMGEGRVKAFKSQCRRMSWGRRQEAGAIRW